MILAIYCCASGASINEIERILVYILITTFYDLVIVFEDIFLLFKFC